MDHDHCHWGAAIMRLIIDKTFGGHTLIVEKEDKPITYIALDSDKIIAYGVTNPNETTYCGKPLYIGDDETKAIQVVATQLKVFQAVAEEKLSDFKAELIKTPLSDRFGEDRNIKIVYLLPTSNLDFRIS